MRIQTSVVLFLVSGSLRAQEARPIIDMHLHAHTVSMYGNPPPAVCTNDQEIFFPGIDPRDPVTFPRVHSCGAPLRAPRTDKELRRVMLEMLERYNIRAVTTGRLEEVTTWRAAAPDRIIPATHLTITRREIQRPFGACSLKAGSPYLPRLARNTTV